VVLVLLLSGCGSEPIAPIDRDTFVQVMAELRDAGRTLSDTSAFDARRREILDAAGVTDSMLMAFVRIHAPNAEYMAEVWDSVDARVNPREFVSEPDTIVR
jgi:hypothetical protein